jgi:hypothetical protein
MSLSDDLKRWGAAHASRYDQPERDEHVLSRARKIAPGTRERAARQLIGRDGTGRRTLMGAAAGRYSGRGEHRRAVPVPMWACDPVPSRNDAGPGFEAPITPNSVAWVDPMPTELRWIDRAIASLERRDKMMADVVREQFCGTGTQRMKAARIEGKYGGHFTYDMYRKELRRALEFLELVQVLDKAA